MCVREGGREREIKREKCETCLILLKTKILMNFMVTDRITTLGYVRPIIFFSAIFVIIFLVLFINSGLFSTVNVYIKEVIT